QSAGNQRLSLCQAQFKQITMRRLSHRCSECSQEMSPTVAAFSGQRCKVYIRADIRPHTFQHTSQQAWRQRGNSRIRSWPLESRRVQQPRRKRDDQRLSIESPALPSRLRFFHQKTEQVPKFGIICSIQFLEGSAWTLIKRLFYPSNEIRAKRTY